MNPLGRIATQALCCLLVAGGACAPATTVDSPPAAPDSGLVASEQEPTSEVDPRRAKIDAIFAEWDRDDSPGCAVGVVQDGELVYRGGYGMANLEHRIPIDERTVFYIASTSKQFTAAAILLLAQRGQLDLEDDVREHIPELPSYDHVIRLRHLLHHTSGLRDYLWLYEMGGNRIDAIEDIDEAIALIARQSRTEFEPGARSAYSNSNYVLLAEIVARVSGTSMREFADANLFEPLGMHDTVFKDADTMVIPRRADGHERDGDGSIEVWRTTFDLVGDGGLHTTVEDLAKWDANFYDNRLGGGDAFVESQLTRGVLNDGKPLDYARGLVHGEHRGHKTVSHGGSFLGYRSELVRFPQKRLSVICLCNIVPTFPDVLARRVADLYLGLEPISPDEPKPGASAAVPPPDPAVLDGYAGYYLHPEGLTLLVEREGERLVVHDGSGDAPLTAKSESTFVDPTTGVSLRFEAAEMIATVGGQEWFRATRIDGDPTQVSARDRDAIVGHYFSPELQVTYILRANGSQLEFLIPGDKDASPPLVVHDDVLGLRWGTMKLQRNRRGRVTGFTLDTGGINGIQFDRVRSSSAR